MAPDFKGILKILSKGEIDFVLVGGYSAVLHGSSQLTRDIDIVCSLSPRDGQRLTETLSDIHPVHRMLLKPRPLSNQDFLPDGLQNLYLRTDIGVIDCLGSVKGIGDLKSCIAKSQWMDIGNLKIRTLTIKALIQAKRAMARPRDLLTADELETIAKRTS